MDKPKTVRFAEILLYFWLGLSAIGVAYTLASAPEQYPAIFIPFFFCIIIFLTIYMIRKGRGRIRIIYLVCFIILLFCLISAFLRGSSVEIIQQFIPLSSMMALFIVLLFTKSASKWFTYMKEHQASKFDEALRRGKEDARRRAHGRWTRHDAEEQSRQSAEETKRRYEEEQARLNDEEEQSRCNNTISEKIQKCFDIFELPYSANFNDIKKKYKVMIKLFHPDRHSSDATVREYASEKTKELNNAFNTLKNDHFNER